MEPTFRVITGLGVVAAVILLRLLLDRLDRARIAAYLRGRHSELVSCRWTPFGKGWFGDNDRIYEVRFRARNGDLRRATVKTSMWSGVYLTDERRAIDAGRRHAVAAAPLVVDANSELRAENERLAAEVERLRAEAERLRDRGR